MNRKSKLKTIGILATIAAGVISLVSNVIEDKKMEETIEEKVNEALAKRDENEEES